MTVSFGHLLKGFRARAGLTQEGLAYRADLSTEAIRALEGSRRRHPRLTTIAQLTSALALSQAEAEQLSAAASRTPGKVSGVPQQLPPALVDFTGRTAELGELCSLLGKAGDSVGVVISAVGGMGGVGKTALAVEACHSVADHYPDGQLYLNLGGGSAPVGSAESLATLLRALGVPPSGDRDDVQMAVGRYRTALAGRRVLVLLDDAASLEQVLPLIPGTAGSAVVITSRIPLTALPGVRHLGLEVLSEEEALRLLGEVVGHDRVRSDPEAAREVVRRCGLLPLAVRIAGGHPSSQNPGGLSVLARLLADDGGRFAVLSGPAAGVGVSIGLSVQALAESNRPGDSACAEAFAVLALFDGDRFPLRAAAKVLELSLDDAEKLLERLVDVQLLETPALYQYRMHDLVRDVGRQRAVATLAAQERKAIWRRELSCYSSMLWRSSELQSRYSPPEAATWSTGARDIADGDTAADWLTSELGNLARLIRTAVEGDRQDRLTAARMAWGMHRLALVRMHYAEARDLLLAVLGALDEPDNELDDRLLLGLAYMYASLDQYALAVGCLEAALPLARARGDDRQVLACLLDLAYALVQIGRSADAVGVGAEMMALLPGLTDQSLAPSANLVAGVVAGATGDLAGQRAAFDRVLSIRRAGGAGDGPPMQLVYMGFSLVESGQYERGLAMLTGVLDRARADGVGMLELSALDHLGRAWQQRGDLTRAREYFELALPIAIRSPRENREADLHRRLGTIDATLGRPDSARRHWVQAITLYDRVADPAADEIRDLL
ncbi:XRE family transcriptional regulator [Kribbella koreensis]|uniref:XRE family transcriptional regulator n=1 Tax=Kribbella koreensis TaxID=57909 RepID=A0ABN1R114_9ACTN